MFVALSAGFASCSDDDETKEEPTLVGTWEPTYTVGQVRVPVYPGNDKDWEGPWSEHMEESDAFKKLVFNEDQTGIFTYDQENMIGEGTTEVSKNFTWTNENGVLKFKVEGEDDDEEEGEDSSSEEIKLIELTATTAVIEFTSSYPLEGRYTSYEKVTYTRVK